MATRKATATNKAATKKTTPKKVTAKKTVLKTEVQAKAGERKPELMAEAASQVVFKPFHYIYPKRWEYFRQRSQVPLWIAVAVTMNLDPQGNETQLKRTLTEAQLSIYSERKKIAISAYGREENGIKNIKHEASGETVSSRYVSLENMLVFAEDNDWEYGDTLKNMRDGLKLGQKENLGKQYFEEDEYSKGAVYNAIRTGALLKLIEQWLRSPDGKIPKLYSSGQNLNFSQLGAEASKLIDAQGMKNGNNAIKAHGPRAIDRQYSQAMKIFETVGKKKSK